MEIRWHWLQEAVKARDVTLSDMMQEQRKQGKACSLRTKNWQQQNQAKLDEFCRAILQLDHDRTKNVAVKEQPKNQRPQQVVQSIKMIEPEEDAWSLLSKLMCLVCSSILLFMRRIVHQVRQARCTTSSNKKWRYSRHPGYLSQGKRNPARYLSSMGSSRPHFNRGTSRSERTRGRTRLVSRPRA